MNRTNNLLLNRRKTNLSQRLLNEKNTIQTNRIINNNTNNLFNHNALVMPTQNIRNNVNIIEQIHESKINNSEFKNKFDDITNRYISNKEIIKNKNDINKNMYLKELYENQTRTPYKAILDKKYFEKEISDVKDIVICLNQKSITYEEFIELKRQVENKIRELNKKLKDDIFSDNKKKYHEENFNHFKQYTNNQYNPRNQNNTYNDVKNDYNKYNENEKQQTDNINDLLNELNNLDNTLQNITQNTYQQSNNQNGLNVESHTNNKPNIMRTPILTNNKRINSLINKYRR